MRQIQLPVPESGVSFHLDRYPCLPVSAGALSWQPNPSHEETPAKALLPAPAPPVRLSICLGVQAASTDRSAVAALLDPFMRKM